MIGKDVDSHNSNLKETLVRSKKKTECCVLDSRLTVNKRDREKEESQEGRQPWQWQRQGRFL